MLPSWRGEDLVEVIGWIVLGIIVLGVIGFVVWFVMLLAYIWIKSRGEDDHF